MSNVQDFGAVGDGKRDDTQAIRHALQAGDGRLEFPPGNYLISETIRVELAETGRLSITGAGGVSRVIVAAAGPAFHIVGTHGKTAHPPDVLPAVWQKERMPTVLNLEVVGAHDEACGFLLEATMQATFEGVLLRELKDGIRSFRNGRNLLISHCHIYNNRGVGVFLDRINLHQAIIVGSHISYCKRGGVKIVASEIRNLQITGNDIEYNFDTEAEASGDIWIDSSDRASSVREGTIVGNTIQAKYSPGGANIRMVGLNAEQNHRAGMFTISGNLIGSQEINVHLVASRGVVVTGNVIYSGHERNLQIDGSRNIVIGPNSFDHNPDYGDKELCTGVRLADSSDCTLTGSIIHDCQTGQHTVPNAKPFTRKGLLEIERCRRINVTGCQVLDGLPYGIFVSDSDYVTITGTSVLETRREKKTKSAIRWEGRGANNFISANSLSGTEQALSIAEGAGVKVGENLVS